ncbi:DUF6286 domain-containing protein [Rothia sp. CCM 9417]|uniref:DUF6286 domain-containing protein n=1 Tax=Rothia sp. CCM 9417 TaxID=3402657 RepID=UPI003AEC8A36
MKQQNSTPQHQQTSGQVDQASFIGSRQEAGPYERLLARQETHSSRWLTTVIVNTVLILSLSWLGTELVLSALGQPPLLITGEDLFSGFFKLDELLSPLWGVIIGVVLVLLGLVLLTLSLRPGRLSRHSARSGRFAMVVDNKALASSISASVRARTGLDQDQVVTSVSPRQIKVTVTPTSGRPLDQQQVHELVKQTVANLALQDQPGTKVVIEKQGAI